jgi:hypothetical protein
MNVFSDHGLIGAIGFYRFGDDLRTGIRRWMDLTHAGWLYLVFVDETTDPPTDLALHFGANGRISFLQRAQSAPSQESGLPHEELHHGETEDIDAPPHGLPIDELLFDGSDDTDKPQEDRGEHEEDAEGEGPSDLPYVCFTGLDGDKRLIVLALFGRVGTWPIGEFIVADNYEFTSERLWILPPHEYVAHPQTRPLGFGPMWASR